MRNRTAAFTAPVLSLSAALMLLTACSGNKKATVVDRPRLTPAVSLHDVVFRSAALKRDMQYRIVLPSHMPVDQKVPVVYMLHGGSGDFRDWTNYSDVARLAETGLILVMPQGDESYYTNSAERPRNRYEDYIVKDLIADVESRFPVGPGRQNRAIVGVSMGGFGAVKLGLRHPEMFAFVAGISSAIDVPRRHFSIRRISQWRHHRSIFGDWGSQTQRENDPFVLARSADPTTEPYFFLTCGEQEGLLPSNREFAALLAKRSIPHEFRTRPGGHNWQQWNGWLPSLFESLSAHLTVQR